MDWPRLALLPLGCLLLGAPFDPLNVPRSVHEFVGVHADDVQVRTTFEQTKADAGRLEQWLEPLQLDGEPSLKVTDTLTRHVAEWGRDQGWVPRFEAPSATTRTSRRGKVWRGRIDVVFDRPGHPELAIEIDSRNNTRSLAKLVDEFEARSCAGIWLRWGPKTAASHSFTGASGFDPELVVPPPIVMVFLDIMCHKKLYYRPAIEVAVKPPATPDEINAARTPRGGWTRDQLAEWGVPWPPPRGWQEKLLRQAGRSEQR
ncbi:hypothetical protein ACIBJI_18865 [Nocardia sp. NPDC050408]|uniref:hypothetical protein n=1 Tax=Nocardia sp. NPDC050408 TaxID=3364319 RepID=UPI0037A6999C